jgi:hypothetical protein
MFLLGFLQTLLLLYLQGLCGSTGLCEMFLDSLHEFSWHKPKREAFT